MEMDSREMVSKNMKWAELARNSIEDEFFGKLITYRAFNISIFIDTSEYWFS